MRGESQSERALATGIWWMALGYFVFYIPYSALVKAMTSGLLAPSAIVADGAANLNGLQILPAVLIGTVLTMPVILLALGWYRYMEHKSMFGRRVPCPSRWAACSGVAFAVIIVSTTLAYSFKGVSILFALLLMRGGVLIMSPLIDHLFKIPVHWYSWLGFTSSVIALAIAVAGVPEYTLAGLVLLNLCIYLAGYTVRLQCMTHYAKDIDESVNRRFFVEEISVAMLVLAFVPGLLAFLQLGVVGQALHSGFAAVVTTDLVWPALLIGVLYGCLGIFGSLIYLNRRENTFAIPVNRCSSLLSGVVASSALFLWFGGSPISTSQLLSVAIILAALMLMSFFDARHFRRDGHWFHQRIFLFICDHNRARSPMASALCNDHLVKLFGVPLVNANNPELLAKSAGLDLPRQRNLKPEAKDALQALGVVPPKHRAQLVSSYDMHRSERILCMTDAQKTRLIEKFPWAVDKIDSLQVDQDLHGSPNSGADQHLPVARQLRTKIGHWLADNLEPNDNREVIPS
jgi:protein-tyrosine-phosphatase